MVKAKLMKKLMHFSLCSKHTLLVAASSGDTEVSQIWGHWIASCMQTWDSWSPSQSRTDGGTCLAVGTQMPAIKEHHDCHGRVQKLTGNLDVGSIKGTHARGNQSWFCQCYSVFLSRQMPNNSDVYTTSFEGANLKCEPQLFSVVGQSMTYAIMGPFFWGKWEKFLCWYFTLSCMLLWILHSLNTAKSSRA